MNYRCSKCEHVLISRVTFNFTTEKKNHKIWKNHTNHKLWAHLYNFEKLPFQFPYRLGNSEWAINRRGSMILTFYVAALEGAPTRTEWFVDPCQGLCDIDSSYDSPKSIKQNYRQYRMKNNNTVMSVRYDIKPECQYILNINCLYRPIILRGVPNYKTKVK